jgi:hypothetical protein
LRKLPKIWPFDVTKNAQGKKNCSKSLPSVLLANTYVKMNIG